MKNLYCLALGLMITGSSLAQDVTYGSRGFIGISLGPAIPVGSFGDQDLLNENSGLANTGLNISLIDLGIYLHDNIGLSVAWLGAAHTIDIEGLLLSQYESNMWSYGALMAGGLYSMNIGKSFADARLMAGFCSTTNPDLYGLLEQETVLSFAYMIGLGIRPRVSKRLSLHVTTDFFHTKPAFEQNNFEQPISTVFINGGICYLFN